MVKVSVADILSDSSVIGTTELAAAAGRYCPELVISLSIYLFFALIHPNYKYSALLTIHEH